MKKVWIYVNTAAHVGDNDHLQVFASEEAANRWLEENDPEGVAAGACRMIGGPLS